MKIGDAPGREGVLGLLRFARPHRKWNTWAIRRHGGLFANRLPAARPTVSAIAGLFEDRIMPGVHRKPARLSSTIANNRQPTSGHRRCLKAAAKCRHAAGSAP